MNAPHVVGDLSTVVRDIRAAVEANDLPALGRMVERYTGADPVATGEPECDLEDLHEFLTDRVREDCYTFGIHCASVGLDQS